MKISVDFTSLNQEFFWLFDPPSQKKIWIFFLQKYRNGYLNELSWQAENVFWYKKIHQRSFRTRIRHVIELYILLINNVPYSGTERSLMNFLYQKTFSARQDDSFKYPYRYFWRKKNFNFFLGWGVKKSIFFHFYDVKSTEIFIFDI